MNIYTDVLMGMLEEIKVTLDAEAVSAAIIVTFVVMDTMAFLSMPLEKKKNDSQDFISWVNKYMKADPSQSYQYDAKDMWAARCAKLHSYSIFSDYGQKNKCKLYGYHSGLEHIYKPQENPELVLISVPRLVNDFGQAIMGFLKEALADKTLKARIDSRIEKLYQTLTIK